MDDKRAFLDGIVVVIVVSVLLACSLVYTCARACVCAAWMRARRRCVRKNFASVTLRLESRARAFMRALAGGSGVESAERAPCDRFTEILYRRAGCSIREISRNNNNNNVNDFWTLLAIILLLYYVDIYACSEECMKNRISLPSALVILAKNINRCSRSIIFWYTGEKHIYIYNIIIHEIFIFLFVVYLLKNRQKTCYLSRCQAVASRFFFPCQLFPIIP